MKAGINKTTTPRPSTTVPKYISRYIVVHSNHVLVRCPKNSIFFRLCSTGKLQTSFPHFTSFFHTLFPLVLLEIEQFRVNYTYLLEIRSRVPVKRMLRKLRLPSQRDFVFIIKDLRNRAVIIFQIIDILIRRHLDLKKF